MLSPWNSPGISADKSTESGGFGRAFPEKTWAWSRKVKNMSSKEGQGDHTQPGSLIPVFPNPDETQWSALCVLDTRVA